MKTLSLKEGIFTALMAALLCVLAPFSLPIGPIPITLATFIIYLIAYLLKWHMALISVVLYLIIGIVGIRFSPDFVEDWESLQDLPAGI